MDDVQLRLECVRIAMAERGLGFWDAIAVAEQLLAYVKYGPTILPQPSSDPAQLPPDPAPAPSA